jgi:hypothetical protein
VAHGEAWVDGELVAPELFGEFNETLAKRRLKLKSGAVACR